MVRRSPPRAFVATFSSARPARSAFPRELRAQPRAPRCAHSKMVSHLPLRASDDLSGPTASPRPMPASKPFVR